MNAMNQFEKQERFKNKAYKRVEKIESSLAVLSCFANRELYDYSASEVMTLFNRIETAIIDTRRKYIEELQRAEGVYYGDEDDYSDED